MATDDERRRVAAALRKTRVFTLEGRQEDGSVVGWQVALMSDLSKAVGIDDSIGFDTFARLADLIDPDTTTDTTKTPGATTKCDREALLALAEGLEFRADKLIRAAQHARFSELGPTMDRAKHDASELRVIARRIREACGETANGLPTSRAGGAPAGIDFELLAGGDGRPREADAPEKN